MKNFIHTAGVILLSTVLILNITQIQAQPLPPVDIPILNIPQETHVWCWVAVAQQIIMASRGPQNTPRQCALVATANGVDPSFCCQGFNPSCVRTGDIGQIQNLIAYFGGRTSVYAPPTDPMTLYRTLAAGRAVIVQLQTGQSSAHVVVIRGMSFMNTPFGVQAVVHVNDPMSFFTQPIPLAQIYPIWMSSIVVN